MTHITKSQFKIGLAILLVAVIVGLVNECQAQNESVNYDSVLAVNFDQAYIKLGATEPEFKDWVKSMNRYPGQLHDNYGDTTDWKFRYVLMDARKHSFQYYFKNGKVSYITIDSDGSQINAKNFDTYKKAIERIYTLEAVSPKTNPNRTIYRYVANDKSHQLLIVEKDGEYNEQVNGLYFLKKPIDPSPIMQPVKMVGTDYSIKESKDTYTTPRTKVDERVYYTGSRGGCYYYSASGKKVYVDHSCCK